MTIIQVDTTTPTREMAISIAESLVERRQAACVQLTGPIDSVYRWEGQVESSSEWRLSIKTTDAAYSNVEKTIRELHSYDEPEIMALEVVSGSSGYLNWIRQQVG